MRSADFRTITYQSANMMIKCTHVQFTTPRIANYRVLAAVVFILNITFDQIKRMYQWLYSQKSQSLNH